MLIGPVEHKINISFKKMDDFESYINAMDIDYGSEDVTFTGYVYKLHIPQFIRVNRSQYGRGAYFKQDIAENIGNNCYIPTSGNCFIKCIDYFTKKENSEECRYFIRGEKYRSGVMNSARIQPFCRQYKINIGCFDGTKVILELSLRETHHCLDITITSV